MNIATWNWKLMKNIMSECHLYDDKANYVPFDHDAPKEDVTLAVIRKI